MSSGYSYLESENVPPSPIEESTKNLDMTSEKVYPENKTDLDLSTALSILKPETGVPEVEIPVISSMNPYAYDKTIGIINANEVDKYKFLSSLI
jgi:hypothetical protein